MSAHNTNNAASSSNSNSNNNLIWAACPSPLPPPPPHLKGWAFKDWVRWVESWSAWAQYDHERRLSLGLSVATSDYTLYMSEIDRVDAMPDVSSFVRSSLSYL
jgi:hypothetical protein